MSRKLPRQFSVPTSVEQLEAQKKARATPGEHNRPEARAHKRAQQKIDETVEASVRLKSHEQTTPLAVYLDSIDMTVKEFSERTGIPESTVSDWYRGKSLPDIVSAFEIERVTKVAVPMEAWLATPKAVVQLRALSRKQPVNLSNRARMDKALAQVEAGNLRMEPEEELDDPEEE